MHVIKTKDEIINYFKDGSKNNKNLKIGVEHERFLYDKNNYRLQFTDIRKLFEYFKKYSWHEIKEDNQVVALKRNDQTITLEPGNQIELSGSQKDTLHEVCAESYNFLEELNDACKKLEYKSVSLSYDPISRLEDRPNNPKKRYKIMTDVMPKSGKLSLNMMYMTSGTQINLDYVSEEDFSKKFNLLAKLTPLTISLFANSPFYENSLSKFLSYRSYVWQNTARGGLPELFLEKMNFEKYADFIINYPLLFIIDKENYIKSEGYTFKDLLLKKVSTIKREITSHDLSTHLATIFTEIRLKKYLEIRSLDTCEWDCHCSGPAFFLGLIYENLDEALELVKNWKSNDIMNAYYDAPKKGLKTVIEKKSIKSWSEILLKLSEEGLKKRNIKNSKNNSESIYLKNIKKILENGLTKAEINISEYNKSGKILFNEN